MQFYTKNEEGEFVEATESQIEDQFRERSDRIVRKKLASIRESEMEKMRPEIEAKLREEAMPKLEEEVKKKIEGEFKTQLEEVAKSRDELDMKFRRKTIAAEYGFKPETEEFLGTGTDDEMRAKADILKSNFKIATGNNENLPEKKGAEPTSASSFVKLNDNNE